MTKKIALMGAGGKMGCRISRNMLREAAYEMLNVETNPAGRQRLADLGLEVVSQESAVAAADVVVLALPDRLIGTVTRDLIPQLQPGTLVIGLDPAAAYAEVMPLREDLSYFVCHPCHPMLFQMEATEAAHEDWFGGIAAKQSLVCALHQGSEDDYATGEAIAAAMFQPILRMHRITVEQMAILEPAVVETTTASLILACKQALDEGVRMGVPEEAAWDFVMGHIRVELAIIFGFAEFPFSDGAKLAIEKAQRRIFRDDWRENIFNLDSVKRSVREITDSV